MEIHKVEDSYLPQADASIKNANDSTIAQNMIVPM